MKALVINKFGDPEVLQIAETEIPQITAEEILVKVHSCGLNPVDTKIRAGHLNDLFATTFPRILGGDISGTIVTLGSDVTGFKIGDEVYFANPLDKNGGYSEFCTVNYKIVCHKPLSLTHNEAATLPVAGLTSVQALRDFCKIKSGDKVLIHAGAGGVGSFAIQYAKQLGAIVFATASASNHDYLKELGADVVIDYNKADFVSVCQDFGGMDIVLESIGGSNYYQSLHATRIGGVVACLVNPPDETSKNLAAQKKIKTDFFLLSCSRHDLIEIAQLIEAQKIKPAEMKILSFNEIKEAHKQLESGKTRGKLVLQV